MSHKLKVVYDHFNEVDGYAPQPELRDEPRFAEGVSNNIHAIHLQSLLIEAYAQTIPEEKLPRRQRLGIIVGTTATLWLAIGAGIFAIL